jgi:hypothetical protein
MTQPQVHTTATPGSVEPEPLPARPVRPGLLRVVRDQRKVVGAAAIVAAVCFWVMVPLGEWRTAALTAGGVLLALLNHLASELWLARLIGSGEEPSRGRIAASAITRLAVLSVVAVGVAVLFWPDGIGLLLGLAIFRLIALVMTGIPLLKELKGR